MSTDPAPPSLPKPLWKLARDVLLDGWDPTSVHGYDPRKAPHEPNGLGLNNGWWNENDWNPHVAITSDRGGVGSSTGSGYDFLTPGGAGQDRQPRLLITVFAEGDRDYGGADADDLAFALRSHIEQIAIDANGSEDPDALPSPLHSMSTNWLGSIPDTGETPTLYTDQLEARFAWSRMPSGDSG